MTLQELISIEEKLLKLEMFNIFSFHFNEIVVLKQYLKEIGEVTSLYFELVEEYGNTIKTEHSDKSYEEKKQILQEYNDNLLKSEVYSIENTQEILRFIEKYQNLLCPCNDE